MENTLFAVMYTLYSLFEMYIIYKLMNMFLGKPVCEKKYVILAYGLRFVVGTVQYYFLPYVLLNSLSGIVLLFLLTLCYGRSVQRKMVAVVMTFMCLIAAETVVAAVYELCNISIAAEGYNGDEFTYIGMAIVLGIICRIIAVFKNVDNNVLLPKSYNVIIIFVCVIIFLLVASIFLQANIGKRVKVMSAISLLVMLFLVMYLYDLIAESYTQKMQARLVEKEKQYYYKQVELMQENGEKLRSFRHDINNHLYVIQSMIDNDTQSTKKYIDNLIKKVKNTKTFSDTGNIAIDSVINYKLSKAENEGISVNADISLPSWMENDEEDMVVVLGNILDNAIEANKDVTEEKYINAVIRYKAGLVFINVANSYDGKMNIKNGKIVTKKSDSEMHGIGLNSVESVVEKYDGTMEIHYDDNQFEIKIIIYG